MKSGISLAARRGRTSSRRVMRVSAIAPSPWFCVNSRINLRHGNPCNGCRNGFSQSFKSELYMKYRWELFLELQIKCGEILRAHLPKRLLYNVLLNNLLKLGTSECVPCLARPKRRQERVSLCAFRRSFEGSLRKFCGAAGHVSLADE